MAVITVKEVSPKKCHPPHSHLHYLSTCQSICLFATQCSEECHMLYAMRKSSTLNVAHWSAILLLFNIFRQFLITTPVAEIKNYKVFYQSCLTNSHQTDSSIMQLLHSSLRLIRNPFQMSSQFFFFHNKAQHEQKREDKHERNKKRKR